VTELKIPQAVEFIEQYRIKLKEKHTGRLNSGRFERRYLRISPPPNMLDDLRRN
jgi:hypothetical protein